MTLQRAVSFKRATTLLFDLSASYWQTSTLLGDALSEQLPGLEQSVDELREEVRAQRDAVDELREVVEHLVRNIPPDFWQVLRDRIHITSMARDPTATDFGERINGVPPEVIEQERSKLEEQSEGAGELSDDIQRQLF